KKRALTRASDHFAHARGAVEFCFRDADDGDFSMQRFIQTRPEAGSRFTIEPDIAVDDCGINRWQLFENCEEARQFTSIKLTGLIGFNVLDMDEFFVERI